MNKKRNKQLKLTESEIREQKRRTTKENRRKILLTNFRQDRRPISEALVAKLAWPWPKSKDQLKESFKRLRIVKIQDVAELLDWKNILEDMSICERFATSEQKVDHVFKILVEESKSLSEVAKEKNTIENMIAEADKMKNLTKPIRKQLTQALIKTARNLSGKQVCKLNWVAEPKLSSSLSD